MHPSLIHNFYSSPFITRPSNPPSTFSFVHTLGCSPSLPCIFFRPGPCLDPLFRTLPSAPFPRPLVHTHSFTSRLPHLLPHLFHGTPSLPYPLFRTLSFTPFLSHPSWNMCAPGLPLPRIQTKSVIGEKKKTPSFLASRPFFSAALHHANDL